MLGFRVWYVDGKSYAGESVEDWKALPPEGVVVAVVYRDTGKTLFTSADWYWLEGDTIQRVMSGPWGSDKPHPGGCLDCVKKYGVVSDEEFRRMYEEALHGD